MNPVLHNSARSPRSLLFETIFGDDFINFGNQLVDDYSVKTNGEQQSLTLLQLFSVSIYYISCAINILRRYTATS